jgi:hypothetical protein
LTMSLSFNALLGSPLPTESGNGNTPLAGDTPGLELGYTCYLRGCHALLTTCKALASTYMTGHMVLNDEVDALHAIRREQDLGPCPTACLGAVHYVACGRCRRVGWMTVVDADAHVCAGPPLLPDRHMDHGPYVIPAVPQLSGFGPGSHRPGPLRAAIVRLSGSLTRLRDLLHYLRRLLTVLADVYYTTRAEKLCTLWYPEAYTIHGPIRDWRCIRGCDTVPSDWSSHVCPRIAGFLGGLEGPDGTACNITMQATGITLKYFSY